MYLEQLGSNIETVNIHLPYVIENKVLSFINTTYTCPWFDIISCFDPVMNKVLSIVNQETETSF